MAASRLFRIKESGTESRHWLICKPGLASAIIFLPSHCNYFPPSYCNYFSPSYCNYFAPRYCNYFPPRYCNYLSPRYCNYFSPRYCNYFSPRCCNHFSPRCCNWTHNWTNFDTFDTFSSIFKNTICSKKCHINDLELSFSATFAESRCASSPCWKKWFSCFLMIFIILWFWAQGPWGPWDPHIFNIVCKYVLWSGTYLEVFPWCLGPQGTP